MTDTFDAVLADDLAQEIRRIDGDHSLGAGALADALIPFLSQRIAAAHAAEVAERDALLGQCYVIAGADTDGNPPERMAKSAAQAVTDLRRDYDEACDELHGPNGWKPRAEAAERDAGKLRDELETLLNVIEGHPMALPVEAQAAQARVAIATTEQADET